MAKTYHVTPVLRFANRILVQLLRWGLPMPGTVLLTVRGRRSGQVYSIPVQPVDAGGQRWLVSPYGETGWVKNARVAGEVALSEAGRTETVRVQELGAAAAAPILQTYLKRTAIVRPYFDAQPDAPLDAFVAEAPRHPVFQVTGPA